MLGGNMLHLVLVLALTAGPPTAAPRDVPTPTEPSAVRARRLRAAGFVAVYVGGGSLAATLIASIYHRQALARLDAGAAGLRPGERLGPLARLTAQDDLRHARIDRNVAIGASVAAAASVALATTFFVMARGRGRPRARLSVAPTWLPSGAGLALHLRLR